MSAAAKEPKAWTKAEEIAFLDKIIKQLGPQSYLGPWLADNRLTIVRDIENDVVIEPLLPGAAYRQAQSIIAEAKKEVAAIIDHARAEAARETERLRASIESQRAYAKQALEAAARRL